MAAPISHEIGQDFVITTSIFAPMLSLEKVPGPELLTAAAEGTSYSVQESKGRIQGVGVSVSGLGAYARAKGSMNFSTRILEKSSTYQQMKTSYGFSAGLHGFWSWIGLGANASYHKEELTATFHELEQEQRTNGKIDVDMYVTGLFPNVPVSASAYILAFYVTSRTGTQQSFPVIGAGAPARNTGAQDQNGQTLPTKDNNSTIDI